VLAELDPTFAQADAGALETQVASLQAEVDRLTAETQHRDYLSDGSAAGKLQAMIYTQRHAEQIFKLENYTQKTSRHGWRWRRPPRRWPRSPNA